MDAKELSEKCMSLWHILIGKHPDKIPQFEDLLVFACHLSDVANGFVPFDAEKMSEAQAEYNRLSLK